MTRGFAIAALMLTLGASLHSRTPPDFSGAWVLDAGADNPKMCGPTFTIKQDAATVSVGAPEGAALVYHLDGTDSRRAFPAAPPRPPDASPGLWEAHAVASVSRAAWEGDRLIVVTHQTMSMRMPDKIPGEFERLWTCQDSYSLDANGRLVHEHSAINDPIPGGTPVRLDIPVSWTCLYSWQR